MRFLSKVLPGVICGVIVGCALCLTTHFAIPSREYTAITSSWYYQKRSSNEAIQPLAVSLIQQAHVLSTVHDFIDDDMAFCMVFGVVGGIISYFSKRNFNLRWLSYSMIGFGLGTLAAFVDGVARYFSIVGTAPFDSLESCSRALFSGFCSLVTLGVSLIPFATLIGTSYGLTRNRRACSSDAR